MSEGKQVAMAFAVIFVLMLAFSWSGMNTDSGMPSDCVVIQDNTNHVEC